MNPRLKRFLFNLAMAVLGILVGAGAMLWALIRAGSLGN